MLTKNPLKIFSLLVILLTLLLVGCNSEEESSNNSKGKQVTLRVLIWGNGPAEVQGEREMYDEFEKDHPNIKVELIHVPWENQPEKFLAMSAGNDQPDLVWTQPSYYASYIEQGLLMPVDELIEKDGLNKDEWLPGALEFASYKGEVYGLPRDIITNHIAFNKDMFDAAGVPYPKDGWTWDDFLEIAKKLTIEEDGKIVQFGIAGYSWTNAVIANGGRLFNEDGTAVLIDSPEAIEAIQWSADLSNVHRVAPTPTESQGLGDLFLAGKAAMAFSGPWNWRAYTVDGGFNWDIVETPGGKAGNKSELLGLSISIGSRTKHPDEAWTLLKWLGHGRGQDLQADYIGAYPSVKRAQENFSKGEFAPEHVDRVHKAMLENTVVSPYFTDYAEAMDMIGSVVDQINAGDLKAADAIPEIAEKIRKEFDMK